MRGSFALGPARSSDVFRCWPVLLPVVGQLQLQPGVVGRLDGDDVGEEVGSQQEADRFDDVGPLWFVSGQRQHGELLVRSQHHHLWSEHHPADETTPPCQPVISPCTSLHQDSSRIPPGLLLSVVVDLDGSVVGDSVGHHLGLAPILATSGSGPV